ncbi:MAG: hypothetical protein J6X61_00535, partial [Clostridia bacterium]|nr:hypothetical protein [Clostridia bacterium]
MKRHALRILSALLSAVMLLPLLPVVAIERDDYTNVAHQDRVYDEILFSDTNGSALVSSGTATKWSKFQPKAGTNKQTTDPLDPNNKVKQFSYTGGFLLQKDYIPTDKASVFATSILIPELTEGVFPSLITFKMIGKIFFSLTYDGAAGDYTYDLFGRTGKVAPNTWMRLSLYIQHCTQASSTTFDVQFSGTFDDSVEGDKDLYVFSEAVSGTGSTIRVDATVSGGEAGFLLDDTYSYIPGDFWAPKPTLPTYENDPARNYRLDGRITLDFGHDFLLSTYSPDLFSITGPDGQPVEYDLIFDPMRPSKVIIDFSSHPLATNTTYTLHRAAGLTDVTGQVLPAADQTFVTRGEEGSLPAKLPLYETPENGYVMPDRYNTGYRCDYEDLVDFYEKYPLFGTSSTIVITEELARAYDYEFCGFKLADEDEPDLDKKKSCAIFVIATSPVYL